MLSEKSLVKAKRLAGSKIASAVALSQSRVECTSSAKTGGSQEGE